MEQLDDRLEHEHEDDEESQLKLLIAKGKEQGFLTYHEVNEHLPDEIVDPEQIEDIINMITELGIEVHESPPTFDLLVTEEEPAVDEDAAAAAALVSVESEFGRTTDPVRMYMREMGTVDLLTREGEIKIAKRIEEGINQMLAALSLYPGTIESLLSAYAKVQREELKLGDIIIVQGDRQALPGLLRDLGCLPLAERPIRLGSVRRGIVPVAILGKEGLQQVANLAGGMLRWRAEGYGVVGGSE